LTAHTRDRGEYGSVIESFIRGVQNYTWNEGWTGPDVLFGGGAENFYNSSLGGETYEDRDYFLEFANAGYQLVSDNDTLAAAANDQKTLGVFSTSNMAKWLDRNVYMDNLANITEAPDGSGEPAVNQPGLKDMTLKAIDILQTRSSAEGDKGWFIMSEAASIDKMMHLLDYDRALGELLELDDTIKATVEKLQSLSIDKETLVLVTADHGHGFDVAGSVDTQYLVAQDDDRDKRNAIGTYQNSGQSQYQLTGDLQYGEGVYFPHNWDPRYTLFQGVMANPDRRENYQVHTEGPREPAVNMSETSRADYYVNPEDAVGGFVINGTLPVTNDQGVHSLTDVPVFAMGPCQELFGGVYSAIDIFYGMAECFGLSRSGQSGGSGGNGNGNGGWGNGHDWSGSFPGGFGPPSKGGRKGRWMWVDEE